jgi:hypothetical protein
LNAQLALRQKNQTLTISAGNLMAMSPIGQTDPFLERIFSPSQYGHSTLGAMAEFERALIQERVRAGIRNARSKGTKLGRPRVTVDASKIAFLRTQGRSWAEIVAEMGIGKGTAQRALAALPKRS